METRITKMLAGILAIVCFSVFPVFSLPPYPVPTITADVSRVINGDTVEVRIIDAPRDSPVVVGQIVTIRYIGIATLETLHSNKPVEKLGKEASDFNRSLVEARTVYLELDVGYWDSYSRLLAYVYLDQQGFAMVNAMLVALGFAKASPYPQNVRYERQFRDLEATARTLQLGLWYSGNANTEPGYETTLSAETVVAGFVDAGPPVENVVHYTAETDPNNLLGRPGQYIGKSSWADSRIEQHSSGPIGGTVEVFASPEDLASRRKYIELVTKDIPIMRQYIYQAGNALVRLEFDFTPAQAAEYEKVLLSLTD